MELFNSELFSEERISELEQKIDSIIRSYQETKGENSTLQNQLAKLQEENRALKEKMDLANNQREKITDKIRVILEKIEKVEV